MFNYAYNNKIQSCKKLRLILLPLLYRQMGEMYQWILLVSLWINKGHCVKHARPLFQIIQTEMAEPSANCNPSSKKTYLARAILTWDNPPSKPAAAVVSTLATLLIYTTEINGNGENFIVHSTQQLQCNIIPK